LNDHFLDNVSYIHVLEVLLVLLIFVSKLWLIFISVGIAVHVLSFSYLIKPYNPYFIIYL